MHADAFEASRVTHLQMVEIPMAFQASLLLITLAKSTYNEYRGGGAGCAGCTFAHPMFVL